MKKIGRILLLMVVMILFSISISQATVQKEIDYEETLETFNNPERGFYDFFYYNFKAEDNTNINANSLKKNLIHLRLGIGNFSKAVNGKQDLALSQNMLDTFDTMLKTIKANGGTAIIRFAYDNFAGTKDLEPSLDMILEHIAQLKPVLEENQDAISYIELGFFGPWGEMHSSKICNAENVSKAIDCMLASAPEKIKIGVRHPGYYATWAQVERNKLNENITQEGSKSYRVGLFNDGYLGSESDLGTFKNREIEIQWLEKQALHTLYGGEVVKNFAQGDPLNTANYMAKEAFRTHTTYLNSGWNTEVINSWKEEIYEGEDELYKGQSGYLYITNHLGYRFVLRNSNLDQEVPQNKKMNLCLEVENVGFANLVNKKVVTIVLEKEDTKYEIQTNLDATKWNSQEVTKLNFAIELPEEIELGEWNAYLRISQYGDLKTDNHYLCIRFANNNIWNEEIKANYIGTFTITEAQIQDNEKDNQNNIPNNDEQNNQTNNQGNQTNHQTNNQDNQTNHQKYPNNSKPNLTNSIDNTTANGILPQTGENNKIIGLIMILIIFAIYFYRKLIKEEIK